MTDPIVELHTTIRQEELEKGIGRKIRDEDWELFVSKLHDAFTSDVLSLAVKMFELFDEHIQPFLKRE